LGYFKTTFALSIVLLDTEAEIQPLLSRRLHTVLLPMPAPSVFIVYFFCPSFRRAALRAVRAADALFYACAQAPLPRLWRRGLQRLLAPACTSARSWLGLPASTRVSALPCDKRCSGDRC